MSYAIILSQTIARILDTVTSNLPLLTLSFMASVSIVTAAVIACLWFKERKNNELRRGK